MLLKSQVTSILHSIGKTKFLRRKFETKDEEDVEYSKVVLNPLTEKNKCEKQAGLFRARVS